ncbi:MAG TPA: O-antigen ligase family protein [Acidobacteriaceae bacterium]|nr:O-antigen ligase family protein [Acidobacteriaceae bacterium]
MHAAALILTILFSLWLVVRDCRKRRSVSAAVWIPIALLLILGSRPVSLWMTGGQVVVNEMGNEVATSPYDQIFHLLILTSSVAIATARHFKWTKLLSGNKALVLFYLFFFASVLWSGDPEGSLKRVIKDSGLLYVGALLFTERDPLLSIRSVYFRCAAILIPVSVVFIKFFPDYARAYTVAGEIMVTGVTTQKNSLGEIVLIFTLMLLWDSAESMRQGSRLYWKRMPWDRLILIAMGMWLLYESQSKTALLCIIVGSTLLLRIGKFASRAANRLVLTSALALPFLILFSQRFSSVIAPVVEALGRNMTFTGRTDIWQHITLKTVNPLIGAGFWNFWGGPGGYAISLEMHTPVPNAHCGYYDMYIDGGFIGIALLFSLLLFSGLYICRQMEKKTADADRFHRIRLAFLVVAIIYNLSETTWGRIGPMWLTTLLMIVEYPRPLRPVTVRARASNRPEVFATPEEVCAHL